MALELEIPVIIVASCVELGFLIHVCNDFTSFIFVS